MARTARGEGESMRAGTQADKQEVTKLIQHCLSLQQVRGAVSYVYASLKTIHRFQGFTISFHNDREGPY